LAETKRKIRLYFLADLRPSLVLGSAKMLSHGLSQKVKSPIAFELFGTNVTYWTKPTAGLSSIATKPCWSACCRISSAYG